MTLKNKSKSFNLSENYLYLKNVFDNNLVKILFGQNDDNYAIDLTKNKKFSYIFLYNLFQKKLAELCCYLNNVLIKK